MSTNDPSLQQTLSEIKNTLRLLAEFKSGVIGELREMHETDARLERQLKETDQRVKILEEDSNDPALPREG